MCGYTDIPFITDAFNPTDSSVSAGIVTQSLSILESAAVQAFDALFTLLHPDVKERLSYGQLECWYKEYVRTQLPAGEATVTALRIGPWTWSVNGRRYEETAEVTYRQSFYVPNGGLGETEKREATIHLVQSDGIWRWFFGTDPTWLVQLPETC
jgi:hypothetical protein